MKEFQCKDCGNILHKDAAGEDFCPDCEVKIDEPDPPGNEPSFSKELENLINKHSIENGSNTPDFILAEYMMNCLRAFENAVVARSKWFGVCNVTGKIEVSSDPS